MPEARRMRSGAGALICVILALEPPARPDVGAPRVRADGGLDQAARGRCRAADLGLFGVGPGR